LGNFENAKDVVSMVVGVIRKFASWEDIEDPEKAGQSYEDSWEFDEPSPRRTKNKRRGKGKKEPHEGHQFRRPGGQMLPKVPVIDKETGEPTGREVRVVGHAGGGRSGRWGDEDRKRRKLERQAYRHAKRALKDLRRRTEEQMGQVETHPGSVLDEEDVIDLQHGAYHPSKWFGEKPRYYSGAFNMGRGGPGHLKPIDLSDPVQRSRFESGDRTLRDIVTDLRDLKPQYEGHKPELGWETMGMDPHFEEWQKRVRATGTQGEHILESEMPGMNKPALQAAAESGKIPVEHHYNVDPETGELMYGIEGKTPDVDVSQIESEARDAPPVTRQQWRDIERLSEEGAGKYVEDREYDKDYESEDEPRKRGTFLNLPWNEETGFTRGSPIDIAFQLLKAPPADWEDMGEALDEWDNYLEKLYDEVVMGNPEAIQEWEHAVQEDPETTRRIKANHPTQQDDAERSPSKPDLGKVGVVSTQSGTQARAPAKVKVKTQMKPVVEPGGAGTEIWFDEYGQMQIGPKPDE
jgi:hypothetical protein